MDYDTVENTPKPKSFTCKLLAIVLNIFLHVAPLIFGILGVSYFDWFIGFCFLALGYILIGFVQSKLRELSLPIDQLETTFSNYEISCWFVDRYLMCK